MVEASKVITVCAANKTIHLLNANTSNGTNSKWLYIKGHSASAVIVCAVFIAKTSVALLTDWATAVPRSGQVRGIYNTIYLFTLRGH